MSPKAKSSELKISRVYDAPVKAVWDAWTDLKQVGQWWGPSRFYSHNSQQRPKARGHLALHHAWPRWCGLSE